MQSFDSRFAESDTAYSDSCQVDLRIPEMIKLSSYSHVVIGGSRGLVFGCTLPLPLAQAT